MSGAYEGWAASWAAGPERVYGPMADALVATCPVDLAGALVLDLGAGTGVASRAVDAVGGRVIAIDLAIDMLRWKRDDRAPAAQGDATALPFASASFDAVVSAFCINHVPHPCRALKEAARVTRPGGVVLASTFDTQAADPVKAAIDDVLYRHGWEAPDWYTEQKREIDPRLADRALVAAEARCAGMRDIVVHARKVELSGLDPATLAAYRIGSAHVAPFASRITDEERTALFDEAAAAVTTLLPWRPAVFVLTARI